MNDTRKQIMEIIEPYMDKTLSEGCCGELLGNKYQYLGEYMGGILIKPEKGKNIVTHYGSLFKPYGVYDITSVLKYMDGKIGVHIKGDTVYLTESFDVVNGELELEIYGEFANKPLHLYTEQEDKDLLELLLKLK